MPKIKWLNTNFSGKIDQLFDGMIKNQFHERTNEGFIVDQKTHHNISGRYINKYNITEEILDPFGNTYEETRTIFDITKFKIIDNASFGLELYNPPRRIKEFLNKLDEISNEFITIERSPIDVLNWLYFFEHIYSKVKVNCINCSDINIANKGIANIKIKSQQDIRKETLSFIGKKSFNIDNIKCSFMKNSKICRMEFSKVASVNIPDNIEKEILPKVRESLILSIQKDKNID